MFGVFVLRSLSLLDEDEPMKLVSFLAKPKPDELELDLTIPSASKTYHILLGFEPSCTTVRHHPRLHSTSQSCIPVGEPRRTHIAGKGVEIRLIFIKIKVFIQFMVPNHFPRSLCFSVMYKPLDPRGGSRIGWHLLAQTPRHPRTRHNTICLVWDALHIHALVLQ